MTVKKNPYPFISVYAVDWHQYKGQHNPKDGEPYSAIKGWVSGSLIEETVNHLTIALTVFDTGDVRDVVVIPKCCVIHKGQIRRQ